MRNGELRIRRPGNRVLSRFDAPPNGFLTIFLNPHIYIPRCAPALGIVSKNILLSIVDIVINGDEYRLGLYGHESEMSRERERYTRARIYACMRGCYRFTCLWDVCPMRQRIAG